MFYISFELSIHQIILKNMDHSFHNNIKQQLF